MSASHHADMERMRAARRRLAQVRQRVRRLSWMARDPESLDPEVPLLSRAAFVRALARFQTIRLRRERAALLAFHLPRGDADLRRAVAMHLIENTRNCDTLGCADERTFLVLLKSADATGANAAMRRLQAELRQIAARNQRCLMPVGAACLPLPPKADAANALQGVLARLAPDTAVLPQRSAVSRRA